MRSGKSWIWAVLGAACAAQAADPPKEKPGLWEVTTVQNSESPNTMKICIDDKTGQLNLGITELQKKSCSKFETNVSGSTITRDAVCKIGPTLQLTTHMVTTFQGNSAYHVEAHSHWDPPLAGKSETSMKITGKWVGAACAAGMKPGDGMGPDGTITHADAGMKAQ